MSPGRPLVSVVLASFNHEAYVEAAVSSVLDQSYDRLELLVVDDGSTDATPDVVAAISDPRLRLVRLPTNRATHPRNVGLELASGELVAFQNSDDVWHPDKLAAQVAALDDDPRLAASFTRVGIIDAAGDPAPDTWASGLFRHELDTSTAWLRRFFDHGNDLCISSAVCRRAAVEQVGRFDPSLFHLSDVDLWIRLASLGDLRVVPSELTSMRVAATNASAPTPATLRRSDIEYAQVLERFTEPPAYDRLPGMFPGLIDEGHRRPVRLALLAKESWERRDLPHRVFGDRLFARLLGTPGFRERITKRLGTHLIAEFLLARGRLEVVGHD